MKKIIEKNKECNLCDKCIKCGDYDICYNCLEIRESNGL